MVLTSTAESYNFIKDDEQVSESPQLVVNTVDFNNQDLKDFINLSEEIERNTRERRFQRKISRARRASIVANMTREEIFESTNIDDDQFLEAMEHETSYDTEKYHTALVGSIDNLMKYFDEDVKVRDESLGSSSSIKQLTVGKVEATVSKLRNMCGLVASPFSKRRKHKKLEIKPNVMELRRKYETSKENEAETTSPSPNNLNSKSSNMSRKTKVKQMASLFNKKANSLEKNSSLTSESASSRSESSSVTSPIFSSTLNHEKSPKIKKNFPNFAAKLPSPKPSPRFKRKQLKKCCSNSSPACSPLTKRKQSQKQESNTSCLVAENAFAQLSVKDKVLLYNKFIADMAKRNSKSSKETKVSEPNVKKEMKNGEVVFERQGSVKFIRDCWEAQFIRNNKCSQTLPNFKRSKSKLSMKVNPKAKEYEDSLQADLPQSHIEDNDDLLHVNTLDVVLKPGPGSKKSTGKIKHNQSNKKNVIYFEDVNLMESSLKRTQNMIRAACCVEPLAPPKKIRRMLHDESSTSDITFRNKNLEKLFFHWLKEKNGVAFEIMAVKDENNIIEIAAENATENVLLPSHEVEKILEDPLNNLEENKQEKFEGESKNIENARENEENQPPLEVETSNAEAKGMRNEESDLGFASITNTTSEEPSTKDLKSLEDSISSAKKLRRCFSLSKYSGLDAKAKAQLRLSSNTLPKTGKYSDYIKSVIYKTGNYKTLSEQPYQLNNGHANVSLNRKVNSPNKLKTAYTLTIMSSPSPYSGSDCYNNVLTKSPLKETSRLWPALLEPSLNNTLTEEEKYQDTMDSFIDQGFETGSHGTESSLLMPRNKSLTKKEYATKCSTPFKDKTVQQAFNDQLATDQYESISPILTDSITDKSNYPPLRIVEEELNKKDSLNYLNESGAFVNEDSLKSSSKSVPNVRSSQFWIKSGDFSTTINIDYYESERLLLLSDIYGRKAFENNEMNFGIDDQKFCLDSSATPDEIIKKGIKENDCSKYWFSTGDIVVPFQGKFMSSKKINALFNYIREIMAESGSLKFGIDNYEFSDIYQKKSKSISPDSGNNWTQLSAIVASPLKTSDLDQSNIESQQSERNTTISLASSNSNDFTNADEQCNAGNNQQSPCSPEQNKDTAETQCNVQEILKVLKEEQIKLKLLEESLANSNKATSGDSSEFQEYMRKFKSIIKAIDTIGRNNGFNACTTVELESFMFLLSRYADLCFVNATAQIENILNVVMLQR